MLKFRALSHHGLVLLKNSANDFRSSAFSLALASVYFPQSCSNPPKADGAPCSIGSCQAGVCRNLCAGRTCPDDDLGVDRASSRQMFKDRPNDFRKVARQRFGAAAGELHLVAVAQHDTAEAIPLRLIGQASGDGVGSRHAIDGLGEHG